MSGPYYRGEDVALTSYHATDGDTLRAHLAAETVLFADDTRVVPGRLSTSVLRTRTDPSLPGVLGQYGPPIRLVTLNTPEVGKVGHADATRDLDAWLFTWSTVAGLRAELWPDEGAFGRYLGDVYVAGDRGNTASQYMLKKGWLPYVAAR